MVLVVLVGLRDPVGPLDLPDLLDPAGLCDPLGPPDPLDPVRSRASGPA